MTLTAAVSLALYVVTTLLAPSLGGPALTARNGLNGYGKLVYTQPEQVHLALGGKFLEFMQNLKQLSHRSS